jgi:hypothetical protein
MTMSLKTKLAAKGKAKPKINPQIARMNAARAAKAKQRQTTGQDEVQNYGDAYGDASQPLERRRTGTQPNNRATSAVERAEARAVNARHPKLRQSPGMDVPYDADDQLQNFYDEVEPDDELSLGEGEEVYPSEDELAEAQQKMSETIARRNSGGDVRLPKGARMAPIGRGEKGRGIERQATMRRNAQTGRIMFAMRDGRMISRTGSTGGMDKFDVPISFIPDGWSYQWIAVSVTGKPVNNTGMFAAGWEPVPAERHEGFFMPKGADGPIVIDDLMLCERRIEATLEARAEEISAAKSLLRTQNDQFKPALPGARSGRGAALRVKRELERMPDDIGRPALRPEY